MLFAYIQFATLLTHDRKNVNSGSWHARCAWSLKEVAWPSGKTAPMCPVFQTARTETLIPDISHSSL
jgi:hypothetical protein